MTLDQAVEIALARNPEVLTALQEMKAAAARRLQAEARPDPSLSFSTEGIPFSLKGDGTEINFGLQQTLEYPGKRALRGEIGRYGEDLASLELERTRMIVAARVKRAYFRAALARQTAAALEKTTALLDQIIESFRIKFEAGQAAYIEVLRARVEKARLRNRILEERRDEGAAAAEINLLLGRNSDEPVVPATDLSYAPFDKPVAEVLETARRTRPALKIAALRSEQAAAEVALTSLNRKPDLTAGLFFPSKDFKSWGISLGLVLPLSGKRWGGERAEAEAGREASLIAARSVERRIAARIGSAYSGLQTAEEQVRVFEQKLLGEIEDELKISLEYYRYGKIEAYSLLDLERSWSEARVEHLRALYLYSVARADLEVAGEDGE